MDRGTDPADAPPAPDLVDGSRPASSQIGGAILPIALLVTNLLAGLALKLRCLGADGLTQVEAFQTACYSDVVTIAASRGLGPGVVPYRDVVTEYPPLTGLQWLLASWTTDGPVAFFVLSSVISGLAIVAAVIVMARQGVPRTRLLLLAAAPTLLLSAFVNWDGVPALLLVAAIAAHRDDRQVLSGVLAGLGAAAKLFPGLLVVGVAWGLWASGRRRDALWHVGAAAGVVVVLLAATALLAPAGWSRFLTLNGERAADWDTLYYAGQAVTRLVPSIGLLNVLVAAVVLVGWLLILRAGRSWTPAERWRVVVPLLLWLLLAGKVYSPQFSVWLLPLLIWTVRDMRPLLAFVLADAAVSLSRFPFLATQAGLPGGSTYGPFAWAVLARAVVLVWLLVLLLRSGAEVDERSPAVA